MTEYIKDTGVGHPQWLSGKESACQCRRLGFNAWSGKIPHALGQLSPGATTTESVLESPGTESTEPMSCSC